MRLLALLPFALLLAACDSADECVADTGEVAVITETVGTGLTATTYDAVTVAFKGFLDDPSKTIVFDDTITYALDRQEVIEGFDTSVLGMRVGGTRSVRVPPALAFGCRGTEDIPSNSVVLFDLRLLSIDRVQIQEITPGTGATADPDDAAVVTYSGRLTDGTVFDSGTFQFTIGSTGVIAGFSAGVNGMKVGGKRQVTIPPALAYGARGTTGIPPNSTLIFEITLNTLTKN